MNLTNHIKKHVPVWMAASLAAAFLLTLAVHALLPGTSPGSHEKPPLPQTQVVPVSAQSIESSLPLVPVYLSREKRIDQVPIEAYVRGVIAAEMPVEFELEALKAQALAARTYIIRRLQEQDTSQVPAPGAIVTDTVAHQAFLTEEQLKGKWSGPSAAANWEKLNQAVLETEGRVILYGGKPINAVFFSTSNGYTENSEDYWGEKIPYLRSVPSPWDAGLSPRYKETVSMPYKNFLKQLGLSGTVTAGATLSGSKVTSTTAGHRIGKISIGGKTFTGREVRERLGLASSQFEWRLAKGEVEITTYGYGHGVGMSQWGANGMAKEGKSAEEIVRYYYSGVTVGSTGMPKS